MSTSLFELFSRGGPLMWAILVCSIVALAVVIERLISLPYYDGNSPDFLLNLSQSIQKKELAQAQRLCDQETGILSRIAKTGITQYGRPRGQIQEQLEEVSSREVPQVDRYIPILGTIAHLTPLLGLLGTVTGLVKAFQVIQLKASSIQPVSPADLAGGIWEALLTTVFGLLVAIPAYAAYNYLAFRVNRLVTSLETSIPILTRLLSGEVTPSTAEISRTEATVVSEKGQ